MNIEIINKLDEITNIIENDSDLKKMNELEKKILNNKDLLDEINKLKEYEKYDNDYLNIKNKILNNKEFKEYKELENDLYFVIQDINKKLNSLREKSDCH